MLGLDGWRPATARVLAAVAAAPETLVMFALTSPDFALA
jgi:hypothetical protein